MCLAIVLKSGTISRDLFPINSKGLCKGYKVVQYKHRSKKLCSPYRFQTINIGEISKKRFQILKAEDHSIYRGGFHIYPFINDAIKDIANFWQRCYDPCPVEILPIYFRKEDILAEGTEIVMNENDKPLTQYVLVVKKYVIRKSDYNKTLKILQKRLSGKIMSECVK